MTHTVHRVHNRSAIDLVDVPHPADESVALVVTSPPYPMIEMWDDLFAAQHPAVAGAMETADGPAAFECMHTLLDRVWAGCRRVLMPGGFLCINIGDAVRSIGNSFQLYANHARIISACLDLGFQSLPSILWRKQTNAPNKFMGSGMLPAGAYVTLEHEYILMFRKGAKRLFDPEQRSIRQESAFFWEERNQWFSDLWDFKGVRQAMVAASIASADVAGRGRSAAFPFELPYRLIHMYSVRGDLVLDPFAGIGTTMIAALAAGRHSLGIEIDSTLCDRAGAVISRSAAPANRRIDQRLADHLAFVAQRGTAGNEPAHYNEPHGFPVMTRQEQRLRLDRVDSVQRVDAESTSEWHATYRPVDEFQLESP